MCFLCLEVSPAGGLQDHRQRHRRGDVECSLCAAHFLSEGDVALHLKDFHRLTLDGGAPLDVGHCVMGCSARFCSWEDHVEHFIARHCKQEPERVCHLCLAVLAHADEAEGHIAQHSGKKQHNCRRCTAQFLKEKRLTKHMSTFHRQS